MRKIFISGKVSGLDILEARALFRMANMYLLSRYCLVHALIQWKYAIVTGRGYIAWSFAYGICVNVIL